MKKTLLILLCLSANYFNGQSILINELMSKNYTTIQDEDGEYSDWIELYNTSTTPINLLNYSLSDEASNLDQWIFPEVIMEPNSYLLVFASGENRLDISELHTNFKISSEGESLYLSNEGGVVIDQTDPVFMSADESLGRTTDGSPIWGILYSPTPNSSNTNSNHLTFSHPSGFYTESFDLTINTLNSDTIHYTLNGDIPTENSNIYSNQIIINNLNSQPNILSEIPTTPEQEYISYKAWESPSETISKATVLMCASYHQGVRTSKIFTKTFFVDPDMFGKYSVPIISIITEEKNLFDHDEGIFVPGVHFDYDDSEWSGNYFEEGEDWEKKVHIEYFEKDGSLGFSQGAGLRIHGGKTRQAAQKSLRLYARKEYGKEFFNYQLLPQKEVDNYQRFLLRSTMGAWGARLIIKDLLAQNISSSLNIDYQDFQPVIVYINGEYWGVHTIRDRIDERFVEYTHNIDKDSVVFREYYNVDYNNLIDFIADNSLNIDSNYEYVKTKIEIDNYIDYTVAELFFGNYDWPGNNTKLWKKKVDGKWRWVFFDIDAGFGNANIEYNMFEHATKKDSTELAPLAPKSTYLFRSLLKNDAFKSQFINRFDEILQTTFTTEKMTPKLDSIQAIYSPEITDHLGRWHLPDSYEKWEDDIDYHFRSFIERRPCAVRENMVSFFDLNETELLCIDSIEVALPWVVAPNPSNGRFYFHSNYISIHNATLRIVNMNGKIVYAENNFDLEQYVKKYLDLSAYSNGTYILQIISHDIAIQQRVVILK